MLEAISPSDFNVGIVAGRDPLRLSLGFKLHNGSASRIQLSKIKVHLYCGGAHVCSVVGAIKDNPSVQVNPENLTIGRGKKADVSLDITPDLYLWFWLLPDNGYSLCLSSIRVITSWGNIEVPLEGNISSQVSQHKPQIDEFRDRVRRVFGINQ